MTVFRKALAALVGGSLLLAGLAMLVLPGPAFVVIPTALAILAIEFVWARRWLAWLRERLKALAQSKSPSQSPRTVSSQIRRRPQQR
ncbi:MAG TPA: PGPGW domain-containing protein [Candidatus Paceibacterota bacterium]|nr:PGPGW domain-containing protein [Verrucomicrobiota bacterium]HRY46733.1 PGPGW domain-containing protein [Candidatus Paceibacterota bacterium]